MDISIISEFFPKSTTREMRGGVEARAYYVARHLSRDHNVRVYAIRERGFPKSHMIGDIRVERVGPETEYSQAGSLFKRARFMRAAARKLKKFPSQVIDGAAIMGYPPAWWSRANARVITYHDVWIGRWVSNVGWAGLLGEAMERYILSRGWDRIIAVSDYTRKNLINANVDENIIDVASNGIDLDAIRQIDAEKYDEPTVCCVARLVRYKRVDDLLRALAEMEDIRLKVIGTGPQMNELVFLAKSLGISDRVDFMGYVESHDQVLKTVASSSALCLPSSVEGFGIAIVEAMALGVPYVASDIPPIREASRGGRGGILYPCGDVKALRQGLETALSKKVAAGTCDIEGLDWKNTAEAVQKSYLRALE